MLVEKLVAENAELVEKVICRLKDLIFFFYISRFRLVGLDFVDSVVFLSHFFLRSTSYVLS